MQVLRQLGGGVIIAFISIILVIGGISLAIAESDAPPATPTPAIPSVQFLLTLLTPSIIPPRSIETSIQIATALPSATSTPPPLCNPPIGWFQTIIGLNDTIYSLSQRYNTSEDALMVANCLSSYELQVGRTFYVPPVPTITLIPCGPPGNWVKNHIVQPGDNLFRTALSYGITYPQLQSANCMGSSITIFPGQLLWVPNRPTLTPIPGVTSTPTFPTSTASFTSAPPTSTMPPTLTPTFTAISSLVPTATASLMGTMTPSRAQTNTSPAIQTQTPSLTPFP